MSKEYTDAYIAFIDILGFKKLIESRTCSDLYEIFSEKFRNIVSTIHVNGELVIDVSNVKMKVMSDSVCFFIDASIPNALIGLVSTCMCFQQQLIQMAPPILTRGAIVRGDIFVDGDIVFGPGFVKAYLMEEHNAKTPRIILTKETINVAMENTTLNAHSFYAGFTFRDDDAYYSINYFEFMKGQSNDDLASLLEYIEHVLDTVIDSSVREKYIYLQKNLLRWSIAKDVQSNQLDKKQ